VAATGEQVILVRRETNPDDLPGMIAAQGILTSRGGKTSHAAVVARGMGKTCVCGAEGIEVNTRQRHVTWTVSPSRRARSSRSMAPAAGVHRGDPGAFVPVVEYFEGEVSPDSDPLVAAVPPAAIHADQTRRMRVRPTPTPRRTRPGPGASAPRGSACAGPSTCSWATARTRRAADPRRPRSEQQAALDALLPLQRDDFVGIFRRWTGCR
jgi:pyruvate,orthophosphate dikinase